MGRNHTTLADYMVLAISPALIMAMITAFVFFLIEVFYAGQFEVRLQFICVMFILGAVMIGRLSMTEGSGYASLFAAPLGLLTAIAMLRYVPHDGSLAGLGFVLNLALLTVIWYAAHKLTWSCTYIENSHDASSQGLLQSLGLSATGDDANASPAGAATVPTDALSGEQPVTDNPLRPWLNWLEKRRKQPQKPGVWIVYFAMAALPIFGAGQWSIAYDDVSSRRYVFWLLCIFVATALALLATTSFLGLRRYLRRRGVEMPVNIAATWLGLGAGLIILVLFVAWLFPRPSLEYSVAQLNFGASETNLATSRYATGNDGIKTDPDSATASSHDQAAVDGKPADGKPADGKPADDGKPAKSASKKPRESRGSSGSGQKPDTGETGSDKRKSADTSSTGKADGAPKADGGKPDSGKTSSSSDQSPPQSPDAPQSPDVSQWLSQAMAGIGTLLKWGFYLLLAAVVGYFAWRRRHALDAACRQLLNELRELWGKWFPSRQPAADSEDQQATAAAPPPAFSSYSNPLATGNPQRTTDEIVAYSFNALEAWGREHGCTREPGQTPAEFAAALGQRIAVMDKEARHLSALYSRVAYGGGGLSRQNLERVQNAWQLMQQHHAPPVAV